ncbi:MAG: biopolymer transporter ExbD [Acidobacteria bacterium]|nr:biopolymer transporter ExbD [Acidobacteriota bacterium]
MQMRPSPGSQVRAVAAVRSEINVTPLVDVCLVLLIIFLVVAPLLRKGIDVALPETANPRSLSAAHGRLALSIRSDGAVFVDGTRVPQDRLEATLKASHDVAPTRPIVVEGDRRLHYRAVAAVLQTMRDAGFERVGLATDKRGPK